MVFNKHKGLESENCCIMHCLLVNEPFLFNAGFIVELQNTITLHYICFFSLVCFGLVFIKSFSWESQLQKIQSFIGPLCYCQKDENSFNRVQVHLEKNGKSGGGKEKNVYFFSEVYS